MSHSSKEKEKEEEEEGNIFRKSARGEGGFLNASNYSLSINNSLNRSRSLSPFEVPASPVEDEVNTDKIIRPNAIVPSGSMSPTRSDRSVGSRASSSSSSHDEQLDLVEATSDNPTAVLELDMNCNVRFLSKSWESIVGTKISKILHKPVSDLIVSESEVDKTIFTRAVESMCSDDMSYRVKFLTPTNEPAPHCLSQDEDEVPEEVAKSDSASVHSELSTDGGLIEMEGQGILIHDLKTQLPTHSMWILRPFVPIQVTLELPDELVDKLGSGIDIFESYLLSLNEMGIIDLDAVPAPKQVLCRICEHQVPAWWLERHAESCLVEHRLEDKVRACHEALIEHKKLLTNMMERLTHIAPVSPTLQVASLSSLSSGSSSPTSSAASSPTSPTSPSSFTRKKSVVEYKGYPLPVPKSIGSSAPVNSSPLSSSASSVVSTPQSVRKSSSSIFGNLRFPMKNLEKLLQYCSEAISINPGELIAKQGMKILEIAYSPNTEKAMKTILTSTLPDSADQAIRLLTKDTQNLAKEKVDAIERLGSSLQYSEKLKTEIDLLVLETVTTTIQRIREKTMGEGSHKNTRLEELFAEAYTVSDELRAASPLEEIRTHTASPLSRVSNLDSQEQIGRSETPKIQIQDSATQCQTPEIQTADHRGRKSIYHQARTSYLSPRRLISPVASSYYANSPMASLQRNSRVGHRESAVSISTPTSSPLLSPNDLPAQAMMLRSINQSSVSTWDSNMSDKHSSTDSSILHPLNTSSVKLLPPLSPLLVSGSYPNKQITPSIKDYEIIKPISKGAFGSVFLTRRRLTGEYFAIKVLKKSDMIAKNQVPNVKAERAIMMRQADSPYVAQLYSSFQSKDYLFLVMEYLNGGDTASLIKMLGTLSNEWARRYIAEVIVGVDDLHKKGIVHRDLKPDNLLIDNNGHLKLTDFGLSRMGLVGRQQNVRRDSGTDGHVLLDALQNPRQHKRTPSITPFSLSPSLERASLSSVTKNIPDQSLLSSSSNPASPSSFFEHLVRNDKTRRTSSNASSTDSPVIRPLIPRSNSQTSFAILDDIGDMSSSPGESSHIINRNPLALFDPQTSTQARKFVGTPDYLAPETIEGVGQDEVSDWWSIGCILFEFLFGYPPFHASTAEKVFENILKSDIDWPDLPEADFTSICPPEGKDLISKLLVKDPNHRLGANGTDEIKSHPYFKGIVWDTLFEEEASFIPISDDPESTDYFDSRGAEYSAFPKYDDDDEDLEADEDDDTDYEHDISNSLDFSSATKISSPNLLDVGSASSLPVVISLRERRRSSKLNENNSSEFGSFQFRNLNALDRANKDQINRLKTENLEHRGSFSNSPSSSDSVPLRARGYSGSSTVPFKRSSSPSVSTGTPSRTSFSVIYKNSSSTAGSNSGDDNNCSTPILNDSSGRNSPYLSAYLSRSTDSGSPIPKILKPTSKTPLGTTLQSPQYPAFKALGHSFLDFSPSSSDNEESRNSAILRVRKRRSSRRLDSASSDNSDSIRRPLITYDVLVCEPIPILRESLKSTLQKLGCAVVAIKNGDELVRRVTGEIKFDFIVTALKTPKISAVDVVKLIKNTATANSDTPIIAVTAYYKEAVLSGVFDYVLEKPVTQKQLREALDKFSVQRRMIALEAISDTEAFT